MTVAHFQNFLFTHRLFSTKTDMKYLPGLPMCPSCGSPVQTLFSLAFCLFVTFTEVSCKTVETIFGSACDTHRPGLRWCSLTHSSLCVTKTKQPQCQCDDNQLIDQSSNSSALYSLVGFTDKMEVLVSHEMNFATFFTDNIKKLDRLSGPPYQFCSVLVTT